MSLREEQEKVQRAMNSALSGLQEDPWLSQRVLANAKGEKKMKRKISLVLVLSIVMGLAVIGGAYALSSSLVADVRSVPFLPIISLSSLRMAASSESISAKDCDADADVRNPASVTPIWIVERKLLEFFVSFMT